MKFIVQLIISTLAVLITVYLMPNKHIAISNNSFTTAIVVAAVLAFMNSVVKPIMILLTIPVTLFTFGLFLLVINALIIILTAKIVPGFYVDGFWWALLFSLILSIVTSILESFNKRANQRDTE